MRAGQGEVADHQTKADLLDCGPLLTLVWRGSNFAIPPTMILFADGIRSRKQSFFVSSIVIQRIQARTAWPFPFKHGKAISMVVKGVLMPLAMVPPV